MKQRISSRERVLATVAGQEPDYVPLCFEGLCHGILPLLSEALPDPLERAAWYLERGIDTALMLDCPTSSGAGYVVREETLTSSGEPYPLLRRVYGTARGTLEQVVSITPDYPQHAKLWSDHNVPRDRSRRFLVETEKDLDVLSEILAPPRGHELTELREKAARYRAFRDHHDVMVSGYLPGVGDPLLWMSGVEIPVIAGLEDPAFLDRYVEIVARLDQAKLELYLDAGVDLVVRRGWYESTDFWSPQLFRRFLMPALQSQIRSARQAGVLYAYVMNSGSVPLFPHFRELGFDLYTNFDAVSLRCSPDTVTASLPPPMTLCGGINNQHVLERGTEEEVRQAVRGALASFAPRGRFLLAPGDSVLATDERARANVAFLIDEWTRCRSDPA